MTTTIILGILSVAVLIVSLVILVYTQTKIASSKDDDEEDANERDIALAECFSLNPNNHLLWNNCWITGKDDIYDDTIWNVLISLDGDVYVKNCAPDRHWWKHFDPNGNDCGNISNIEVKALESQRQIGFPIAFDVDENGQNLALTLDL